MITSRAGSASSFLRTRVMRMSTLRSSGSSGRLWASSLNRSRDRTWFGCRAKVASRSSSMAVSATSRPVASSRRRASRSRLKPPNATARDGGWLGAAAPAGQPAEHAAHPGQQLARLEGLGHIVVGTGAEAGEPALDRAGRGEHDDPDPAARPRAAAGPRRNRPRPACSRRGSRARRARRAAARPARHPSPPCARPGPGWSGNPRASGAGPARRRPRRCARARSCGRHQATDLPAQGHEVQWLLEHRQVRLPNHLVDLGTQRIAGDQHQPPGELRMPLPQRRSSAGPSRSGIRRSLTTEIEAAALERVPAPAGRSTTLDRSPSRRSCSATSSRDLLLVVDDEHAAALGRSVGRGAAARSRPVVRQRQVTRNRVPGRARVSTSIRPPCAATMPWQTDSPTPVPTPCGLVVKNGSKTRFAHLASMPGPLSATSIRRRRPRPRPAPAGAAARPREQRLLGVDDRLMTPGAAGRRRPHRRQVGGSSRDDLDIGGPQPVAGEVQRALHHLAERHRPALRRPGRAMARNVLTIRAQRSAAACTRSARAACRRPGRAPPACWSSRPRPRADC